MTKFVALSVTLLEPQMTSDIVARTWRLDDVPTMCRPMQLRRYVRVLQITSWRHDLDGVPRVVIGRVTRQAVGHSLLATKADVASNPRNS